MAHLHSIYDCDTHFVIDLKTREIKNDIGKTVIVQNDHNSERFSFELPKMIEGHDMSLCNVVQVHYVNVDSKTKEQHEGLYAVGDLQISPDSDDVVILSWLLSQEATRAVGSLYFGIVFKCIEEDGTLTYSWHTTVNKDFKVVESLDHSNVILEEYPDILAQFEARLAEVEKNGGGSGGNIAVDDIVSEVSGSVNIYPAFSADKWADNTIYTGGDIIFSDEGYCHSPIIKVKPNTQYAATVSPYSIKTLVGLDIIPSTDINLETGKETTQFATPTGCDGIVITIAKENFGGTTDIDTAVENFNSVFMLVEGNTLPTEFVPYVKGGYKLKDNVELPDNIKIPNVPTKVSELKNDSGFITADDLPKPTGNIKTRYEPINKKIFEGKKLWVFGDSITYGVGTTDPYYFPNILAESLGCELTKKGCSGFAFSHGIGDYGNCVTEHMNYYIGKAPGNCDIMLVCFGVNDWTWGRNIEGDRAIGNLYDTTKYTICGAVNLFCQQLQTFFADYPDTKIYFVTPTPTKNAPLSGGSGKSWNQSKTNYNGNTLRDICNAIIQTASLYGYQSLDLNLYFDGDVNDTVAMDEAFPDGLHPNEIGNQKMARTIENLLIANPITTFEFNPLVTELDPLAKSLIYKGNINGEIEEPEEPETPEEPEQATLTSISAKYIGGSVLIGSDLSTLTDVIVTASYSDGTTATVTDYTLSGTIAEGSNTITATYQDKTVTFTVYGIPNNLLDTLTLGHIFTNDVTGDNLVYDQTTHKLTVGSTGWNKSSYFTTPIHVGDEVELLCNFTNTDGTSGNYVSIFTQADIENPEVLGYFVKPSILGLYASGASPYKVEQQDALTGGSRHSLTPSIPESGVLFNDDKLVLKLTEAGVELYIADVQYTLYASTPLVAGENYYLGLHMNNNGKYGATVNYIGAIRE